METALKICQECVTMWKRLKGERSVRTADSFQFGTRTINELALCKATGPPVLSSAKMPDGLQKLGRS